MSLKIVTTQKNSLITLLMYLPEDGDSMFLQNAGIYESTRRHNQSTTWSSSPPWQRPNSQVDVYCLVAAKRGFVHVI
jgi:hypothetical protein